MNESTENTKMKTYPDWLVKFKTKSLHGVTKKTATSRKCKNVLVKKMIEPKKHALLVLKEMNLKEECYTKSVKRGKEVQFISTVLINGNEYKATGRNKKSSMAFAAQKALDNIIINRFKQSADVKSKVDINDLVPNDTVNEFPWSVSLPYIMNRYVELADSDQNNSDVDNPMVGQGQLCNSQVQSSEMVVEESNKSTNLIATVHELFQHLKFVECVEGNNKNLKFGCMTELDERVFYSVEENKKSAKRSVCGKILDFYNVPY